MGHHAAGTAHDVGVTLAESEQRVDVDPGVHAHHHGHAVPRRAGLEVGPVAAGIGQWRIRACRVHPSHGVGVPPQRRETRPCRCLGSLCEISETLDKAAYIRQTVVYIIRYTVYDVDHIGTEPPRRNM